MSPVDETAQILRELGVTGGGALDSVSPIDGSCIGSVAEASLSDVTAACAQESQSSARPAARRPRAGGL